jgi:hypothetical protein
MNSFDISVFILRTFSSLRRRRFGPASPSEMADDPLQLEPSSQTIHRTLPFLFCAKLAFQLHQARCSHHRRNGHHGKAQPLPFVVAAPQRTHPLHP